MRALAVSAHGEGAADGRGQEPREHRRCAPCVARGREHLRPRGAAADDDAVAVDDDVVEGGDVDDAVAEGGAIDGEAAAAHDEGAAVVVGVADDVDESVDGGGPRHARGPVHMDAAMVARHAFAIGGRRRPRCRRRWRWRRRRRRRWRWRWRRRRRHRRRCQCKRACEREVLQLVFRHARCARGEGVGKRRAWVHAAARVARVELRVRQARRAGDALVEKEVHRGIVHKAKPEQARVPRRIGAHPEAVAVEEPRALIALSVSEVRDDPVDHRAPHAGAAQLMPHADVDDVVVPRRFETREAGFVDVVGVAVDGQDHVVALADVHGAHDLAVEHDDEAVPVRRPQRLDLRR
jgi:hypothetical protein